MEANFVAMFKGNDSEWFSWLIENEEDSLISSNFSVIKQPMQSRVYVPRLWIENLSEKYSLLQILRTPQHKPKDPFELVAFIEKLESFKDYPQDLV
jgi:hypothetical protein